LTGHSVLGRLSSPVGDYYGSTKARNASKYRDFVDILLVQGLEKKLKNSIHELETQSKKSRRITMKVSLS
jgi:hypothetical protein